MTARASMRAGAGYVTACVPRSLQAIIAASGTPELMTRGLQEDPAEDGSIGAGAVGEVLEATRRGGALALGPGLGRSEAAVSFARALARQAKVAMVLDADGLNAHAGCLGELAGRAAPTVLTPHAGELAPARERQRRDRAPAPAPRARGGRALCGGRRAEGRRHARRAPRRRRGGERRRLARVGHGRNGRRADGRDFGAARAGTRRVHAAAAGVFVHAEAGRQAARRAGSVEGVVATDVVEALPRVRHGGGDG